MTYDYKGLVRLTKSGKDKKIAFQIFEEFLNTEKRIKDIARKILSNHHDSPCITDASEINFSSTHTPFNRQDHVREKRILFWKTKMGPTPKEEENLKTQHEEAHREFRNQLITELETAMQDFEEMLKLIKELEKIKTQLK
jgi:hypothetical protein